MYLIKQHASEYQVEITEEEKKKIEKAAEQFTEENTLEDKEAVRQSEICKRISGTCYDPAEDG